MFWGVFLGFVTGSLLGLWYLPSEVLKARRQALDSTMQLRHQVEPSQVIADSLAEGKALAKQKQQEVTSAKP